MSFIFKHICKSNSFNLSDCNFFLSHTGIELKNNKQKTNTYILRDAVEAD